MAEDEDRILKNEKRMSIGDLSEAERNTVVSLRMSEMEQKGRKAIDVLMRESPNQDPTRLSENEEGVILAKRQQAAEAAKQFVRTSDCKPPVAIPPGLAEELAGMAKKYGPKLRPLGEVPVGDINPPRDDRKREEIREFEAKKAAAAAQAGGRDDR